MKTKSKKLIKGEMPSIDAVALKNHIQAELYQETKNLNSRDLIEYYRIQGKTGPLTKKR